MSSVYTSSSAEDGYSLDRPLVVKCTFGQKKKRITFASARITLDILRQKIEKCFSLFGTEYRIIWKDDDGETWPICEGHELGEAISFFASEEQPPSSNASSLSGYSSSSSGRKITVHVDILIDYDGPSLSETSSIASREDYEVYDEKSSLDFSTVSRSELEDDEVTVSSKDATAQARVHGTRQETIHGIRTALTDSDFVSVGPENSSITNDDTRTESHYLSGPFERLKLDDQSSDKDPGASILQSELGAAWLRDQTIRTIKSTLGALPEPSDKSNDLGDSEFGGGDLSLQQGPSGKYYYSYKSRAPSSSDSGYDENPSIEGSTAPSKYRPTSMDLAWFESLEQGSSSHSRTALLKGFDSDRSPFGDIMYSEIPPEVLPFIVSSMIPQPDELTTCSQCDIVLDSIRYVCSTCKVKKPRSTEEIKASRPGGTGTDQWDGDYLILYPPPGHQTDGFTATKSINGYPIDEKPIPLLSDGTPDPGYELCPGCLESSGVEHALETSLAPGSSPSPTSPENALSLWRRSAPRNKGQLRHAYLEKAWGPKGWQDVQQDELYDPHCSTCNSVIIGRRYKCVSCKHFNLCLACYSQVHEIHPSHAFLVVLDTPRSTRSRNEPGPLTPLHSESNDIPSMQHPGVKCAHCLQDIVGARFHCVACTSVDICSNCESVGLPGNLDSFDGGHNSSHIMIKIPYPLESSKVQAASRQAMMRWNGGDADNVQYAGSRLQSRRSSWDGTVRLDAVRHQLSLDHGIQCSACSQPIVGTRYQCGNCPSRPQAYNLCSVCEERSYVIHDSTHAFFKFRRPVDRPVESTSPILPRLYKHHVGPSNGVFDPQRPKEYLKELLHSTAYCDRHMTRIQGEWFRCAYCDKDLCDNCEAMDTHDDNHFFVVFKAAVDMESFFEYFNQPDNANPKPPIVPYPVYLS